MKFFSLKNKWLVGIFTGMLVLTFIFAPVSQTLEVKRADAFLGGGDPATIWLVLKEQFLDMIVWELINLVLEELVKSMTDWVQSGFRGKPAFVTDFSGFLLGTADKAAGQFIEDVGLSALCSPFKLDIQAALSLQYGLTTRYAPQCTLSGVIDNVEGFLDGDFYAGGWDGWARMTLNPQNNVYGATFNAQVAMSAAIRNSVGEEIAYLDFGSGYFGQEKCDASGKNCQRVTPGETVNESLNNALNIGNNRLELADELNELFGALLSQLMKQILTNDGGLTNYNAQTQGPAPTPEEARAINDAAEAAGQATADEGAWLPREGGGGSIPSTGDSCPPEYTYAFDACWPNDGDSSTCGSGYISVNGWCWPIDTSQDHLIPDRNGCVGIGCTQCTNTATMTCGPSTAIPNSPRINGVYAGACRIDIVASYFTSVKMTEDQCNLVNQTIDEGTVWGTSPSTGLPYVVSGRRVSDAIEAIEKVCGGDGESVYFCGYPGVPTTTAPDSDEDEDREVCVASCYAEFNCPQSASLCAQIADVNNCIANSCPAP